MMTNHDEQPGDTAVLLPGTPVGGPPGGGAPGAAHVPARTPRGPGARALTWAAGLAGGGLLILAGVQGADALAQDTSTEEHTYTAAGVVELVADGEVQVGAGTGDVQVVARNRVGFADVTYSGELQGDRLVIENRCRGVWFGSCSTGLDVRVPEGTAVVVRASSGSVVASGIVGDVDLRSGDGSVTVDGVDGAVVAVSGSGGVDVHDATGSVEARSSDGRIRVVDAGGDVLAGSGSGGVEVASAGGTVDARTSDGPVDVRDAGGAVVARSGSGRVSVADAGGRVEAQSSDGGVEVLGADGDAQAISGSGRVVVVGADGEVEARSSDGEVEVSEVTGGAVAVSGSGSVTVEAVEGDIEASSSDGRVTVYGTGAPVRLEIATSDGRQVVEAATDPSASRSVLIRSGSGDVSYLGPR